jgi:hypothetical protein
MASSFLGVLPILIPPKYTSLTFNEFPVQPCVLWLTLPMGHKEFGSLLITDCTVNINILASQPGVKGETSRCYFYYFLLF